MVEPSLPTEKEEKKAVEVKYYSWSSEMTEKAEDILKNPDTPVTETFYSKLETDAKRNWDIFYKNHKTKGYKDRHYIKREFLELSDA